MRRADFRPGIIRGKAAVFPISLKCVHFKELFQPVCEVVQTSLCVVLGDDLGAGTVAGLGLAVGDDCLIEAGTLKLTGVTNFSPNNGLNLFFYRSAPAGTYTDTLIVDVAF